MTRCSISVLVVLFCLPSFASAHEPAVEAWARAQGEKVLADLSGCRGDVDGCARRIGSERARAFWRLDSLRFSEALRALRRQQGVGGALQQHIALVSELSRLPATERRRMGSNCTELVRELENMAPELGSVLRATAEATLDRLAAVDGARFPVVFHVSAMVAYYRLGALTRAAEQAGKVLSYPRYGERGNFDLFHAAFVNYTRRFLAQHPELGINTHVAEVYGSLQPGA